MDWLLIGWNRSFDWSLWNLRQVKVQDKRLTEGDKDLENSSCLFERDKIKECVLWNWNQGWTEIKVESKSVINCVFPISSDKYDN